MIRKARLCRVLCLRTKELCQQPENRFAVLFTWRGCPPRRQGSCLASSPAPLGDPGLRETPVCFGLGKAPPNSPFAIVEWLRHGGGLKPCPTRPSRRAPRGDVLHRQRDSLPICHRPAKKIIPHSGQPSFKGEARLRTYPALQPTKSPAEPGWCQACTYRPSQVVVAISCWR